MAEINQTIQLDLSGTRKKPINVMTPNGEIKQLNIDLGDFNILTRLKQMYGKFEEIATKASERFAEDLDNMDNIIDSLDDLDTDMKACIDFVFDTNVSEICVGNGSIVSMYNGKFFFETIMEGLANLCGDNVAFEYKKMEQRIKKRTQQFTK
jgi:hypothetical protein